MKRGLNMSDITSLSRLSFFKVSKYEHFEPHICDFSDIPRPHYCMGLIFEGSGEFVSDGKKVCVNAGDIIFVPVGSTYISSWHGSPDVMYISVHFSFEFNRLFGRTKKLEIQKVTLPDVDELRKSYLTMYENCEGKKTNQLSALSEFYNILSRVYPTLKYTDTKDIDARVEKAIDYIEFNWRDRIQIDELAKVCNMSTSHFYSCFKECTGYSPIEYKQRVAIRNAELMLVDGSEKSIEEISELAGFTSSIYFRELFKKITGKTPTKYRKYSETEEYSQ